MSDSDNTNRRKTIASLIGGVIGGALGVGLTYDSHNKRAIKAVVDKNSSFHENYQIAKEFVSDRAQEHDAIEQFIHKANGTRDPYARRVAQARKSMDQYDSIEKAEQKVKAGGLYQQKLATLEQSPAYLEMAEAKLALERIRETPEKIHSIHFTEAHGKPVAHINLYPDSGFAVNKLGKMEEVVKVEHKIIGVAPTQELMLYEHAGVKKMPEHLFSDLANASWFAEAEKTVLAAEEKLTSQYARIFRESAGHGWGIKQFGAPDMGSICAMAAAGLLIGGTLAAALAGKGKHARALEKQKAQEAANPTPSL